MKATVGDRPFISEGDRLVIKGLEVGEPDRDALVLEVRRRDGTVSYLVRWGGDGHEELLFPGPDTSIDHVERYGTARPNGE